MLLPIVKDPVSFVGLSVELINAAEEIAVNG
jgi:hypothetical protein